MDAGMTFTVEPAVSEGSQQVTHKLDTSQQVKTTRRSSVVIALFFLSLPLLLVVLMDVRFWVLSFQQLVHREGVDVVEVITLLSCHFLDSGRLLLVAG